MTKNPRDIQFAGSAKLLMNKLLSTPTEGAGQLTQNDVDEFEKIIARHIYDILVYDRMNSPTISLDHAVSCLEAKELIDSAPDMAEWPEWLEDDRYY